MKTCRVCGDQHPLEDFPPQPQLDDGRDTRCYPCLRAYNRSRYAKSPDLRAKRYAYTLQARLRNQKFVWDYLEAHPCVDCGESDPVVLQFDHKDPSKKSFGIGNRESVSLSKLQEEIDKCDVRCANCHTRRTAVQFNWHKWRSPLNKG